MPLDAGVAAFRETRYLEALQHFREAWEAAEKAGAPDQVRGKILTNTGACLLGLGDYRGSLAQFVRARVRGARRQPGVLGCARRQYRFGVPAAR